MAVTLNPRAERLLARLPRVNVYSGLELLLLLLIAVQCARLFWGVVVPLGPVGDYKALDQIRPAASPSLASGAFDPFFRDAGQAPQGPATVTALEIRLYGITANRATGGGTAIIGTANGDQRVYQVGEEIMPGVTLIAVGFDFVTISRNGTDEQLYLDQTSPASPGAVGPDGVPITPPQGPSPVPMVVAPPPPVVVAPPPVQSAPAQQPQVNQ